MKITLKNSLLGIATAFLAVACQNEQIVYHSYQSLPKNGWEKGDTLLFKISIADSLPTKYNLYTEIRNKTDYPYHNLHLFISQNFQDSTIWLTDTITFHLANTAGKWLGKGWGGVYQSELFTQPIATMQSGHYTIKIANGMKDSKLHGISDIGIRIEKQ